MRRDIIQEALKPLPTIPTPVAVEREKMLAWVDGRLRMLLFGTSGAMEWEREVEPIFAALRRIVAREGKVTELVEAAEEVLARGHGPASDGTEYKIHGAEARLSLALAALREG